MEEVGVPWAEGAMALVYDGSAHRWIEAMATELWGTPDAEASGRVWLPIDEHGAPSLHGRRLLSAETQTKPLPGQCTECWLTVGHASDCARGVRVAANLALGVWPWLAPFVMREPPPHDLGCEVFQVYRHGLAQMINMANAGDSPDWRIDAAEPGEDMPDQYALGWVALGQDGPTLSPWEAQ